MDATTVIRYFDKMLRTLVILVSSCLLVTCLEGAVKLRRPFPMIHRIVGGRPANIRDHPYQASLGIFDHLCGASIINKRWLISAAHCMFYIPDRYYVSVGSSDATNGTIYGVKNIVVHPLYDDYLLNFDIALVEVDRDIEFNEFVQPIELAEKEPSPGLVVNVTGWGETLPQADSLDSLQVVSVPIVNRTSCQKIFEGSSVVTPIMICAGYEEGGRDSCQGDSGGPLAANGVLYGVVSWGHGCARPRYPGVYANVAAIRTWALVKSKIDE